MRGHLAEPLYVPSGAEGQEPRAQLMQPTGLLRKIVDPFTAIFSNANQRAALLFTMTLMLGHFTIIPFIAPYMQINVGFADKQVSLIYLIGGLLTVVLLPLFGKLADRYGRLRVFTLSSVLALFSIYALTNLTTTSIPLALLVTSSFFVVASGRNVPATTMITSVVRPENRGRLYEHSAVGERGGAVFQHHHCRLHHHRGAPTESWSHYEWLGYFTILMSVVAIFTARRIKAVA